MGKGERKKSGLRKIRAVRKRLLTHGEEAEELLLEVGSEDVAADGGANFGDGPEATTVEFGGRKDGTVVGGAEDVDQLALAVALKDIAKKKLRSEIGNIQFLAHLATEGRMEVLAKVDMSANGSVPASGLDVLPHGTLLEEELATTIENMKMDDRMEEFSPAVTFASRGFAHYPALLID